MDKDLAGQDAKELYDVSTYGVPVSQNGFLLFNMIFNNYTFSRIGITWEISMNL